MRRVRLEPNTEDAWGVVQDADQEAPVQCWRSTAMENRAHGKWCHRGCAAFQVEGSTVGCLAMPARTIFAELVGKPTEEG